MCVDGQKVQHIVVKPCFRELAFQISEQFQVLGKPIGLKQVVITGGRGEAIICVFFVFFLFVHSTKTVYT